MNDLVSIVVPIYNVEEYLPRCIDSIAVQSYKNIEIILVDDGSPDKCGEICDKYEAQDNRIKVIHKSNGGLSSARNAGLEIASGNFIVFIDSDDWIDKNYIEVMYNDMISYNADIVVPAFCISYDSGKQHSGTIIKNLTEYSRKRALENFLFNGYITPCVASKMWKKELWNEIKCPEGKLFEDQFTTYKLIMIASKVVFDPSIYYYYFKREGSIGHSSFNDRTYDLLKAIKEEYEEITKVFPELTSSLKVARVVWEMVFINMMINTDRYERDAVAKIQKRTRKCLSDVYKCKYIDNVRKIEISLFCLEFHLYKFVYKRYKAIKGIS